MVYNCPLRLHCSLFCCSSYRAISQYWTNFRNCCLYLSRRCKNTGKQGLIWNIPKFPFNTLELIHHFIQSIIIIWEKLLLACRVKPLSSQADTLKYIQGCWFQIRLAARWQFLICRDIQALKLSNSSTQHTVVISHESYEAPVDCILSAANSQEWYCQSAGQSSSPVCSHVQL